MWVPATGQAASRALRKPERCPRAMRNILAPRNPHCSHSCNPRAAELLSPSGCLSSAPSAVLTRRWWSLVPRGVWKASIDLFGGTCCHPSAAPSSAHGCTGAPLAPITQPRSPHLAHLLRAVPVQQLPGTDIREEAAKESQRTWPLWASRRATAVPC